MLRSAAVGNRCGERLPRIAPSSRLAMPTSSTIMAAPTCAVRFAGRWSISWERLSGNRHHSGTAMNRTCTTGSSLWSNRTKSRNTNLPSMQFRRWQANPCTFVLDPDIARQYGLTYNPLPFCFPSVLGPAQQIPDAGYFKLFGFKNSYGKPASSVPYFASLVRDTAVNAAAVWGITAGIYAVVATGVAVALAKSIAAALADRGRSLLKGVRPGSKQRCRSRTTGAWLSSGQWSLSSSLPSRSV